MKSVNGLISPPTLAAYARQLCCTYARKLCNL